jgi:hypothetical protein
MLVVWVRRMLRQDKAQDATVAVLTEEKGNFGPNFDLILILQLSREGEKYFQTSEISHIQD